MVGCISKSMINQTSEELIEGGKGAIYSDERGAISAFFQVMINIVVHFTKQHQV